MIPTLHGYRYSVYLRIARLVLEEKGVTCRRVEVNPFDPALPADYLKLHPFGRVPTLVHGDFTVYETGAITRYVDRAFPGPSLQPGEIRAQARLDQIVSVVDSYAYWPMVRQVFSHAVFRPRTGQPGDADQVTAGLAAAPRVLAALEGLAAEDSFLTGAALSLADLHLGAMMAYFVLTPQAAALLNQHPKLAAWWGRMAERPSMIATDPGLPAAMKS